jgi:hypothetical protein
MGILDSNFDPNALGSNQMLQMGLSILANNQGHGGAFAPAFGGGVQQGMQQAQAFRQQQLMNEHRKRQEDFQKQQFDTQQANRTEDRGWQVADKAESRGFQVSDKADDREFQRLMGKEQFGQQLTMQENQFKQAYQMQKQNQGFQAGQQARSQDFQAGENKLTREQQLNLLLNKPRGMSIAAQKELIDTEDGTQGSREAVKSFNKALTINNEAMGGFGAGALATAGSILPDFARPNTVDATKELDNVLQGSALPQLKAIFGGMPTEGERAILLEVQGSSSQPAKVREGIFNRAIEAANKRIQYNTEKAKQLRNGTYFTEDGGVNIPELPTTDGSIMPNNEPMPDFQLLAQKELARRKGKK